VANRAVYVLAGGGTGGHLFPGIAVAEEILSRDPRSRIVFVGSGREIELEILVKHGFEHETLHAEPSTMLRRNPIRFLWHNWHACRMARMMLKQLQPKAIIGLGGFVSVPVVVAASSLGVPSLLLEQNVVPGRATRWLSGRAALVCLSFAECNVRLSARAKTCVTGNPVRREIVRLHAHSRDSERERPYRNKTESLLILGGSQGASSVNEAVLCAVQRLRAQLGDWRIVHQTGRLQCDQVRRRYVEFGVTAEVVPFISDLTKRYAETTVAISRAGATTLAELACAGTPTILLPYPNSIRNHQFLNARLFESAGAARIVEQGSDPATTASALAIYLRILIEKHDMRGEMCRAMYCLARPDAARQVVDRLRDLTEFKCSLNQRSA